MRTYRIIILSCVCIAAVSCASLGKYQPVEDVPDAIFGNVAGAGEPEGIANFKWQEIFTDPILQEHIANALQNNVDLKIAEEHIAQAEAMLKGAKLSYIPTLDLNGAYGAEFSGNGLSTRKNALGIAGASTWQLSIFRLINNQKSAKASVEQMRDYRQAVQSMVVANVAKAYYSLLMLDSQLETSKDMQKTWRESVNTVISLKDSGLADQVAVSQYEANLNQINITVTSLESRIAAMQNVMNLLLAVNPDTHVRRGHLKDQSVPAEINTGVPALMLTLRPDVRAAERDLELAYYAKRGAILDFFPSIAISGDISLLNPLADIAGSLTAPILSAGRNRAALEAAKSKQKEAELSFTKTLLEAGKEVNDAFYTYDTSRRMADDYYKRAVSLDQARQDTEYLMRNSIDKTYLDVLYANTNFLEAKLNAIANQAQMLQSIVDLYASLGGGSI
ncbi:MAG: TolC family protein [Bacteroidales bacterium]|nr:TolC family protein [Bacteroidales bacterium]